MLAKSTDTSSTQVVCVGEALFDFIADQKGLPRDKVKSWKPYPGGAPCNVATCLGKLGVKTAFVSALGQDDRGRELMELLKERDVDVSSVQLRSEPTRDVYVTRDEEGDREFAGFGLPTDKYSDCFISKDNLPLDKIKSASYLVTGTLGLAYPDTRAAMHAAADAARAGSCQVLVDINWRPVFWSDPDEARRIVLDFLEKADLVKISDADLEWLYGMELQPALNNPCSVAEKLPNAKAVLVTAGDEGAAYCFRSAKSQHSGFVPIFKVDVVDTTGAGDAFTAGFVYKLVEAGSLESLSSNPQKLKEAIVFAAACGALTCTNPGAIRSQPTLEECMKLFEESKQWQEFW